MLSVIFYYEQTYIFKYSSVGMVFSAFPGLTACSPERPVRFGIVTDLHYAGRETGGTRYYRQSIEKLQAAMDVFNRSDLDFIIELGDFKDQDIFPQQKTTLAYLNTIEEIFHLFQGPVYHVLGNHDMDSISKNDFLQHIRNYRQEKTRNYYSFIRKGIKFIVLDANYTKEGQDYNAGNFDWTEAYIPEKQQQWLRSELISHSYPVIVFTHQLLDSFSGISPALYVLNAGEIRKIFEESENVLAVIQGHHHPGHYSQQNGIHYWTVKAMIEGSLPESNSFAIIEIDQELNLKVEGYYNCENRNLQKANR